MLLGPKYAFLLIHSPCLRNPRTVFAGGHLGLLVGNKVRNHNLDPVAFQIRYDTKLCT